MFKTFPGERPGQWHPWLMPNAVRTAVVTCAKCGMDFSLQNFEIQPNGAVNKPVKCPNDTCSFKDTIRVYGWMGA